MCIVYVITLYFWVALRKICLQFVNPTDNCTGWINIIYREFISQSSVLPVFTFLICWSLSFKDKWYFSDVCSFSNSDYNSNELVSCWSLKDDLHLIFSLILASIFIPENIKSFQCSVLVCLHVWVSVKGWMRWPPISPPSGWGNLLSPHHQPLIHPSLLKWECAFLPPHLHCLRQAFYDSPQSRETGNRAERRDSPARHWNQSHPPTHTSVLMHQNHQEAPFIF